MSIKSMFAALFGKGKVDTPKKERSLVDHFKSLERVKDKLFTPIDRVKLAQRVFQRSIADIQITSCDVVDMKARFSTGGYVWAFDSKVQTPVLRQPDNDKVSSIEQYKAFSNTSENIPDEIYAFYSRGFITWTTCAQFATHEIINRACAVRGEDAVAVGYELAYADTDEGGKIADANGNGKTDKGEKSTKDDFLTALQKQTKRMGIDEVLRKLDYNKCVYGIGIAVPTFDGDVDMSLPFNIDAPGLETYTGFTVVEPYWLCPTFDQKDASDPASRHFFEPTWWRLPDGRMIHRSWCIKAVNSYVADILKPTYIYGGIPLTQMIYERVFAADKCANEAPMLALTKRLLVVDANIQQVLADPQHVKDLMDVVTYCRTNWGVMFKQPTANINQIDTSLGEYDQLIMTQYQLVASIAQMPATKLLKVTPTGFQSTGEYEWKDWAQSLIDIQEMEFTPMLERHFQLLTRKRGKPVAITIKWNAVDAPTAKEKADIQATKVSSYTSLLSSGAVSVDEIRAVLRNDKDGEFTGLSAETPKQDDLMTQLKKRMGGDDGDSDTPAKDEAEDDDDDDCYTGDDPEFESKHKRDKDGKFTRTAGEGLHHQLIAYKKERGKQVFKTDKRGRIMKDKYGDPIHLYDAPIIQDDKWTFPQKSFDEIVDSRKPKDCWLSHFFGGDMGSAGKYTKPFKVIPTIDKDRISQMKPRELFTRTERPVNLEVRTEKVAYTRGANKGKKHKVVTVTPKHAGKPVYGWSVSGERLSDKDAFALERALVAAGYQATLDYKCKDVKVRRDFMTGSGQAYSLTNPIGGKRTVKSARVAVENRDRRIEHVNSVFKAKDKILDRLFDDMDDGNVFGIMAYFQFRTTMRCGSSSDNQNKGMMQLQKRNVTVEGDNITIDYDAKNAHWHTTIKDRFLAKFLSGEMKNMDDGDTFFNYTDDDGNKVDYDSYREYLAEVRDDVGLDSLGSHDMRRLAASSFAAAEVDKIKIDPKKDRDGYIDAIADVVRRTAAIIGDESAAMPFNSYISTYALWHNAMFIYNSDDRFKPKPNE